ncbi:hypothetical protein XU18_2445 [Perkinsela sp. CCAP 1560/4]|nr:hypothetical protein XU18_2445 [Perkinsela sp. CCAP 1560/4]|eukprot:KNH06772.1 hypothetical protein XU18_2445 [Perkinsela sp. CCAP 1560/4]
MKPAVEVSSRCACIGLVFSRASRVVSRNESGFRQHGLKSPRALILPQIAAMETLPTNHCRIDIVVGTCFPDRLNLSFSRFVGNRVFQLSLCGCDLSAASLSCRFLK